MLVPLWIACTKILPLPFALIARSAVPPDPSVLSFSVMLPLVVCSTMLPLPDVVIRSLCVASMVGVTPASAPTRCTVTATSSTVIPSLSSRYIPPLVARALTVPTVVSIALVPLPIPVPADRRRAAAVMSLPALLSPSMILRPAITLTLPVVVTVPPNVTSVPAFKRTPPLPVVWLLVVLSNIEPDVASTSIVPAVPVVIAAPVTGLADSEPNVTF